MIEHMNTASSMRILIVENDPITIKDIEELLENTYNQVNSVANTHDEAINLFVKDRPGLVLIDIHLDGEKSGFNTASQLSRISKTPVIYLFDHSKKKIPKRDNVADSITPLDETIFLPNHAQEHERVMKKDIRYVEGDGSYTRIYTKDKSYVVTINISTLTPQLNSPYFLRVSKKYLINVLHIKKFSRESIWIEDKQFIIGGHYRKAVYKILPIVKTKL